jgi:hypothetical protein
VLRQLLRPIVSPPTAEVLLIRAVGMLPYRDQIDSSADEKHDARTENTRNGRKGIGDTKDNSGIDWGDVVRCQQETTSVTASSRSTETHARPLENIRVSYVKVTPMVSGPTATYFSLHVMNARPTTKIAGSRLPSTLKSFRVCVRVKTFFRMHMSVTTPETLKSSQKMM